MAKAPFGHWKTTTFVAALRRAGLDAPMVLDGPMTGPAFLAYVEQVLIPTLRPDEIVVMDNLPALQDRRGACRNRSRRGSALSTAALFARHEPDRDGFRQTQDTVAPGSRTHTRRARRRIGALLDQFTPEECTNYSEPPAIATHCENARCLPSGLSSPPGKVKTREPSVPHLSQTWSPVMRELTDKIRENSALPRKGAQAGTAAESSRTRSLSISLELPSGM